MGRSTLGFPDLSSAGETSANRNSLPAEQEGAAREAGGGVLQADPGMAGFHGCAGAGTSVTPVVADIYAERQRKRAARTDPTPPSQGLKDHRGSRQDRFPTGA